MVYSEVEEHHKIATPVRNSLIFEQPLNETIRLCLRIESLNDQFHSGLTHIACDNSQTSLHALLKLLNVIDRPDLKSKLTQTLSQQATTLEQLKQLPQVDTTHLHRVLDELNCLLNQLHNNRSKLGANLRQKPFLNQVYSHLNNPGGLCDFAIPAYAQWQIQSPQHRSQQLKQWLSECQIAIQAALLILKLTRESTPFEKVTIENGFHHQALDASQPCQLIRLRLSTALSTFPEISVGKHHLSARFMQMDYASDSPSRQFNQSFNCELACCRL